MISLTVDDVTAPIPRQTTLVLTCDGAHGLFPVTQSFRDDDGGFYGMYREAMRVGWKDTSASGTRLFLCPECSGK